MLLYTTPVELFRPTPGARSRLAGKALALSILLHIAGFLSLPYLPSGSLGRVLPAQPEFSEPGKIYYRLTQMDLSERIPRIDPQARGLKAASPSVVAPLSPPESTETHAKLTIILRPPHPDNAKQSIFQSLAAPDLRMTLDLNLPNLILEAAAVPKPQFRFNPNDSRPVEVKKSVVRESAPTLTTAVNSSMMPLADLPGAQAHLPVPAPPAMASAPSQEAPSTPDGALSALKVGSGLVIIGKDPGQATAGFSLPVGDRWSEVSISSSGGASPVAPGKPGGNATNTGEGTGGGASTGLGHPDSRGSGTAEMLTIGGNGPESLSLLETMLPETMVFAVPASMLPRKKAFVVSAGPIGGGGLDVYGALHCGKIDTIFVPMQGSSWTLQFCEAKRETATNESRGRSLAIRLEQGLAPPEVELRFDFRRLPLPQGTRHKLILLRGLLRADGSVEQVEVFRGVQPQMDEAARIAFSRWKFKPAMRESQPVEVEILVGIPSELVRVAPAN